MLKADSMNKPQLYIKEKGRYKPYVEPVPDDSDVLYRRDGRKYVPHSMTIPLNVLDEGVWVVAKHRYSMAYTTPSHLRELFRCERVSDLKEVSVADLGGMDKLANHLQQHYHEIENTSLADKCRQIVGILFNYGKEEKQL